MEFLLFPINILRHFRYMLKVLCMPINGNLVRLSRLSKKMMVLLLHF